MPTLKIQKADGTFEFLQLAGEEFADIGNQVLDVKSQLAQTEQQIENIEVSITKYAHLVANNDWSQAIIATIAELQPNQTFSVPFGNYEFSQNIVCNKKINVKCDGVLVFTGVGVAFTYGAEGSFILDTDLKIKLRNKVLNWSIDTTGFRAINIGSCHLDVEIFNFKKGLELLGKSGGCQYNTIFLKTLYNNQENLRYVADNPSGWINQNTIIGGRFGWQSGQNYADAIHVNMIQISQHKINNNNCYGASFECADTLNRGGKAFIIQGFHNAFRDCRYEGIKFIEFAEGSNYNLVENGYELNAVQILGLTNTGENIVSSRNQRRFFGANNGGSSNVFKNVFSSSGKAFSVENNAGTEVIFGTANGILSTNNYGYFENGIRFSTNDGTRTDRGLFVGSGNPVGSVSASVGSLYIDRTGTLGNNIYFKVSGTNTNTGWQPLQLQFASTTANRPIGVVAGFSMFDTTLQKPIWWTGTLWKDATGATV